MKLIFALIALLFTLSATPTHAQTISHEEYCYPLLDVRRLYSANFGEMRPDHFHSGIDIKTDGVEGKGVVAIADGYIARIVDKPSSYGRALYVVHPDKGTTSVYGHLSHFRKDIDSMILAERYRLQRNTIEVTCPAERYPVRQGEIIGYSGNSGNSFGPHLHFEIRHTATQRTLNIITEGIIKINDKTPPTINGLYFISTDSISGAPRHSEPQRIALHRTSEGCYTAQSATPIRLGGTKGHFVLDVTDRKDGVWNRFGVYRTKVEVEGKSIFEYQMKGFTFDVTRYCNAVAYYPMQLRARSEVIRLARTDGNLRDFYTSLENDGVISLSDTAPQTVLITTEDDCHNRSTVKLSIIGGGKVVMPELSDTVVIDRHKPFAIERGDLKLSIPKYALYESSFFRCAISGKTFPQDSTLTLLSPGYEVMDIGTPLHRAATLSIKGYIPHDLRPHTAIATLSAKGKPSYVGGTYGTNSITARIRRFGEFWIVADTAAPTLTPRFAEGESLRDRATLVVEAKDNFSGIKEYSAYINGVWVPLEYSPTRHTLTHHFDQQHPIGHGEHILVIIAEDNCGNRTSLRSTFTR